MVSPIPRALRQILRAEGPAPCCAYCRSPERLLGVPLEVDHIVPAIDMTFWLPHVEVALTQTGGAEEPEGGMP